MRAGEEGESSSVTSDEEGMPKFKHVDMRNVYGIYIHTNVSGLTTHHSTDIDLWNDTRRYALRPPVK